MASFHQAVAQGAWVLPVPGSPKAKTFTPRSMKLPWARWSSCWRSAKGIRSCSKVSQVLPEGSLDARRSRLMRRWRRSSASCSSTSRKVGKASPWPGAVKRSTDWAPTVGNLNWPHSWPMRYCMMTVVPRQPILPACCLIGKCYRKFSASNCRSQVRCHRG